jgi:triphosphatase
MIEHELKFTLTDSMAAEFEQRATIGLTQQSARLWSRYFDTSAGDLMNAAVSLRVRKTPEGHVQTVKAPGSDTFERYEWEMPISGEWPEFDALPPQNHPAGALTRECFGLLMPVFDTDFDRQVRLVRPQPGVRVEIARDRGEIRAGKRTERIAEVELERKEGSAAAFYHYAMQWARLHQAQLLLPSKNLRGLQLAGWQTEKPKAVKVQPRSPQANLPVAAAAREILVGHLDHFLANIAPVTSGTQPEGVHQLRVALRRFRAAIRFLDLRRPERLEDGSVAAGDVSAIWQDLDRRARALADAASFVRDADVLESGLLASLCKTFPGDAALHVLGRSLATERERERARLRETMASPDLTAFVIQAHAAVQSLPASRWWDATFGEFAAGRLAWLVRRVRRRARRAKREEDWHELRIAIKNLRYALESCLALEVTTQPIGEAISALSRWQSSLGLGQDLAVARSIAAQALAHTAAPTEVTVRAAALIDGYRAFATRIEAPEKLRAPLLAMLKRLLVESHPAGRHPSPPTASPDAGPAATSAPVAPQGAVDQEAASAKPGAGKEPPANAAGETLAPAVPVVPAPAGPDSGGCSGYHPGTPVSLPDAPRRQGPHTNKEE